MLKNTIILLVQEIANSNTDKSKAEFRILEEFVDNAIRYVSAVTRMEVRWKF